MDESCNTIQVRYGSLMRSWVQQARRQELAEAVAWEAKRSENDRKRTTAHHAATQNRQLRDMLAWQRLLACVPAAPRPHAARCAAQSQPCGEPRHCQK